MEAMPVYLMAYGLAVTAVGFLLWRNRTPQEMIVEQLKLLKSENKLLLQKVESLDVSVSHFRTSVMGYKVETDNFQEHLALIRKGQQQLTLSNEYLKGRVEGLGAVTILSTTGKVKATTPRPKHGQVRA